MRPCSVCTRCQLLQYSSNCAHPWRLCRLHWATPYRLTRSHRPSPSSPVPLLSSSLALHGVRPLPPLAFAQSRSGRSHPTRRRTNFGRNMVILALQKPGTRNAFAVCRPNTGAGAPSGFRASLRQAPPAHGSCASPRRSPCSACSVVLLLLRARGQNCAWAPDSFACVCVC